MKVLHWFREDLRLSDNMALSFAAQQGPVGFVFVMPEGLGAASHWWLHFSLRSLAQSLANHNADLILTTGDPVEVVPALAEECGAGLVTWNRVYSPAGIEQGEALRNALSDRCINGKSFNSQLLIEPTKLLTKQETPYKVFTPFWRACLAVLNPEPCLPQPKFEIFNHGLKTEALESWGLLPNNPDWASGIKALWQPGETGAHARLEDFLEEGVHRYSGGRDIPSEKNTSFLSPHLAFGEIGPRQIWHAVHESMGSTRVSFENGNKFLSEIGWREFSRYLLVHFPNIIDQPYNRKFDRFPWSDDQTLIRAWQKGETGYPIVDAGMRELWHTGFMHNRVRMIVASFLTKHCLSHWQHGMDWFWDTLVDADIANNTASWQWAAGCGADASPYFRIFNPITQGEKFDTQGDYVRKWVPELKELPNKYVFKPWEASHEVLQKANVELGKNYPRPVVDHREAREKALAAYQAMKA